MDLHAATVIGGLTVFFGVLVKAVGFPDQIRKNWKNKSTKGLSTTFILLAFISYVLWTLHGILRNDWVLIVGQGVGIITTGVIIYQIILYGERK